MTKSDIEDALSRNRQRLDELQSPEKEDLEDDIRVLQSEARSLQAEADRLFTEAENL
jgi:prefoldin subunit 5